MLRVLLVDDEPFITKGLAILIDWEKEGYEIVGICENGEEALKFLENQKVDLIIADIRMPVMTGIELIENIRSSKISDAYFVILSGYNDFSYMQKAIRYECMDYILKPIKAEELLSVLRKVSKQYSSEQKEKAEKKLRDEAYLSQNISSLLMGKYDETNLQYVKGQLSQSEGLRYIYVDVKNTDSKGLEEKEKKKQEFQKEIYQRCIEYVGENYLSHCIWNINNVDRSYEIGILYCSQMAEEKNLNEEEYLYGLIQYLQQDIKVDIAIFIGDKVDRLEDISISYGNASTMQVYRGFSERKKVYYYDRESQRGNLKRTLCKTILDELVDEIVRDNHEAIRSKIECLYEKMNEMSMNTKILELNINYLLFQLIHIASEQDSSVNQEEIVHRICEDVLNGMKKGLDIEDFTNFAIEYAQYLVQLRKNLSSGVLLEIEREIRTHFSENLTLKGLSKKYFVNSAYLGQIFIKKYGMPFKDYLNNCRIEQATELLMRTEKHVYEISEEVGYKNLDYFIERFIAVKGCTPTKYRKKMASN